MRHCLEYFAIIKKYLKVGKTQKYLKDHRLIVIKLKNH